MISSHLVLFLVTSLVNNLALTSPQNFLQSDAGPPPLLTKVPDTSFSCKGRPAGYYSDLEVGCQVYHMCDILEKQFSYMCPMHTLFNQRFMVCDHWYAVNCSVSEHFYHLNLKIGQVPGTDNENDIATDENPKTNIFSSRNLSTDLQATTGKPLSAIRRVTSDRPISGAPKRSITTTTTRRASNSITTTKPFTRTTGTSTAARSTVRATNFRPATTTENPTGATLEILAKTDNANKRTFAGITGSGFARVPLISGRRAGIKVKFINNILDSGEELTELKFRPLFRKNRTRTFFDKKNFTIAPHVFAITPAPLSTKEDSFEFHIPEEPITDVLSSFLVPPLETGKPQFTPKHRNSIISTFLLPPAPDFPIIIHGVNQEVLTPLVLSIKIEPPARSNTELHAPEANLLPPQFPFRRDNRAFFIPPSDLPPLTRNGIQTGHTERPKDNNEDVDGRTDNKMHRMTMTFPSTNPFKGRPFSLRRNPNCPQCHPAFLRLHECQPCVIIK